MVDKDQPAAKVGPKMKKRIQTLNTIAARIEKVNSELVAAETDWDEVAKGCPYSEDDGDNSLACCHKENEDGFCGSSGCPLI